MYDIAIVGAGPAGSTLARLVAGRGSVLLIERRRLNDKPPTNTTGSDTAGSNSAPTDTGGSDTAGSNARASDEKCCGGLLAPDAQKELAVLGLALPREVLVGPQLFAVRAMDLAAGMQCHYQRHYINVDRRRLDRWLLSLVPSSVEVRTGAAYRGHRRDGDAFRIVYGQDGREREAQARLLVLANGAGSRGGWPGLAPARGDSGCLSFWRKGVGFRSGPHGTQGCSTYIAIQEWLKAGRIPPCFAAVFDEEITDFYSWVIPKGEYVLVGSALQPGPAARAKFELLKGRLRLWGFELGGCVRRQGALLRRPLRDDACGVCDGLALVGEAGGWVSPSSAEGISYALATAQVLARAIGQSPDRPLDRYHQLLGPLRANLRLKRLKCRVMYNPLLRRAILRSGWRSIEVADQPASVTECTWC